MGCIIRLVPTQLFLLFERKDNMKKLTALTIALMMSAGVAVAANHAEQHHPMGGGHGGKMHGQFKKQFKKDGLPFGFAELNLSDAQKAEIKRIMEADRSNESQKNDNKMAEFKQKMDAQRKQERALMSGKNFDEAAARQMIAERQQERMTQQNQRAERELKMLKKRHAIFQVLTAEQQKQYQANQEKKMAEMQKRHENRFKINK